MNVVQLEPKIGHTAILQLHRAMDIELCHLFLGQALKRIREFAERYDTDADPITMVREFEQDFAAPNHTFFLVVAVRDLKVVGHFLSRAEFYYGKKYVYILQLDIFGARLSTGEVDSGMRMLRAWQQAIGAQGIRGGALTDTHQRFYRRFDLLPYGTLVKG